MKAHKLVLAACVLACLAFARCASIRSVGAPVLGGAAGAGVGFALAGPVGGMIGAGITAAVLVVTVENAALRSGETIGEEAHAKEFARSLGAPPPLPWWLLPRTWIALFGAWFAWRMRAHLLTKKPAAFLRGLAHSFWGSPVRRAAR